MKQPSSLPFFLCVQKFQCEKWQNTKNISHIIQHSTFNFLCLRSFVINQRNTTYSKQGSYGLYAESPPWRWWRWWRLYIRNGMYRWIIMCYKRIVGMIGFFKQIRSRRWGLNSFMRSVDVEGRFKHIYFFYSNSNKHDQNIFDSKLLIKSLSSSIELASSV